MSRAPLARALVSVGLAVSVVGAASLVRADSIDPVVPTVLTIGAPAGTLPEARGDGARTGRTSSELPSQPAELWRRNLTTIEVSPIVDSAGAIIAITGSGDVVKLGTDGKEVWRAHVQGGGPASPPTTLSDGAIAVVTTGGTFTCISPEGKVRFSTSLGLRGPDLFVPPVSTDDGGLAIIAGRSLTIFDADGAVTSETPLPVRATTAPLRAQGGWLVVGDDGTVSRVSPPKQPVRVGRFDGPVDGGAALADERTLLAVMHERLVALDLETGVSSTRASVSSTSSIDAPVAVGVDGTAYFTTSDGLFVAVDSSGQERLRATVERALPSNAPPAYGQPYPGGYYPGGYPPGGGYGYYSTRLDPPVVVDRDGRVAFVRGSGRFGVVEAAEVQPPASPTQGPRDPARTLARARVTVATEHVCATPIAVLPAGKKRVAVVCREGTIAEYGD